MKLINKDGKDKSKPNDKGETGFTKRINSVEFNRDEGQALLSLHRVTRNIKVMSIQDIRKDIASKGKGK